MENEGGLVVGGLADNGPAEKAGVRPGDRVVALGDEEITDLGALWRRLWSSGSPGTPVRLRLQRDDAEMVVRVQSADRAAFLRAPRVH
jgi:S1-C subfamily serine protease